MPIFEYTCQSCDHDFEVLVRGGESLTCPHCGARRLTKRLSVPAVHRSSARSLPICGAPDSDAGPCGPGFCRTGQCDV